MLRPTRGHGPAVVLAALVGVAGATQAEAQSLSPSAASRSASSGPTVPQKAVNTVDARPIGGVALSFNPLGFVQFGPIVNAEFGLQNNIAINTHVRLLPLGVLSYVVFDDSDGLDNLTGIGVGGGVLKFFGNQVGKPYVGGMLEYARSDALYADGAQWEWSEINDTFVFIMNGGYRFRFEGGFFLNTGVFLGSAFSKWDWDYTDSGYGNGGSGTTVTPFGMVELTLGVEF